MTGRRYTKLPFYGSTDLEEFLDWQEQMEIELEVQEFSETKKISRAILEFEDYALDVTPLVFSIHICTAFHEHEHHASIRELISHET